MKEIKIDNCPYCGATEFTKGYQTAQGSIYPQTFGLKLGCPIEHTICTECGSIVHSRVTKIERFK